MKLFPDKFRPEVSGRLFRYLKSYSGSIRPSLLGLERVKSIFRLCILDVYVNLFSKPRTWLGRTFLHLKRTSGARYLTVFNLYDGIFQPQQA